MKPPILKIIGTVLGLIGLLILCTAILPLEWSLSLMGVGVILYSGALYQAKPPGIRNDAVWRNALTNRGIWGWVLGIVLTAFYIAVYWYPEFLGFNPEGNTGIVALFDPLSRILNGNHATQWFMYGSLYSFAIFVFGLKFLWKYRHNRYQLIRTLSVIFFQLVFAFWLPEFLAKMNPDTPYFAKDFKNMWPLNFYFFDSWHLKNMLSGGNLGRLALIWGLLLIFVISPLLTYFYGKRWYCSWVCGCGALAETAGDPFRQLSSKKLSVWKLERWMVHLVLVLSVLTTIALLWSFFGGKTGRALMSQQQFLILTLSLLTGLLGGLWWYKRGALDPDARYALLSIGILIVGTLAIHGFSDPKHILGISSYKLQKWYGFGIGAAFSGVLGVGFYPLLGSRVWCRFGCPMAAILGLQQRLFSRFRITTNGGQCISCGNCSTYCEMGIDVRSYAQRGENIVRSSCVGCGICSAVCPRGVLRLENGSHQNRITESRLPLGNLLES